LPDDPRVRTHALTLAQERRHSIEARRRAADEVAFDSESRTRGEEQLSLFQALSSTVLGGAAHDAPAKPSDGIDPLEDVDVGLDDLAGFDIELPPPPPLPGRAPDPLSSLSEMRTRESEKRDLRDFNSVRVAELARLTGWDHARVNGELNRRAGIKSIAEATVAELATRLREADRWIASNR
jgi:hypothetical protein